MTQPLTLIESIHIATLFTRVLEDHETKEGGNFTLDVNIPISGFMASTAKQLYVQHEISRHLASAILDTQVPVEYWMCNINPEYAAKLNLPPQMAFGK